MSNSNETTPIETSIRLDDSSPRTHESLLNNPGTSASFGARNRPEARFTVSLTNKSDKEIYLPDESDKFTLAYLTIKCSEMDPSGNVVKTLRNRLRCAKIRSLVFLDKKAVAPNQTVTYKDTGDLSLLFPIEFNKIYKLDFAFNATIRHAGHKFRYESNTCSLQIRTPMSSTIGNQVTEFIQSEYAA